MTWRERSRSRRARTKRTVELILGLSVLTSLALSQPPLHTARPRSAEAQEVTDTRQRIHLAPAERDTLLREMRTMLESISGIVHGLAAGDMSLVEKAAGTSAAATAVDPRLQEKLSPQFLQLRMKTHQRFAQLAAAAKSGATRDDALKRLAAITGYCVACHAAYRLEETR